MLYVNIRRVNNIKQFSTFSFMPSHKNSVAIICFQFSAPTHSLKGSLLIFLEHDTQHYYVIYNNQKILDCTVSQP